jgi:hypothetical protein
MNIPNLWQLIKSTLIEKDGTNTYGSIKRWGAWILFFYAGLVIFVGLLPSCSFHISTWFNLTWNHKPIDTVTLQILLTAIGTYILGGATVSMIGNTIQNYHTQKYGSDTPPTTPTT